MFVTYFNVCKGSKSNYFIGFVRTGFLPIDFEASGSSSKKLVQFEHLLNIFGWKKITVVVPKTYISSAKKVAGFLSNFTDQGGKNIFKVDVESYNEDTFNVSMKK